MLISLTINKLLVGVAKQEAGSSLGITLFVLSFIFAVANIYILFCQYLFPRLNSIGLSRWLALVAFVPNLNMVFILFLLFCPIGAFVKKEKTP